MIKAKAKAKAMIKAIPPLPLRSLVAMTKSSKGLSKISPNVLVRGLERGPGFESRAGRGTLSTRAR